MFLALVNGKKVEATKGAKGECPLCQKPVYARCGKVYINHWSHLPNKSDDCDSWHEPETGWHKNWKFINDDSLHTNAKYIKHIELEKTLISKYELGFLYGKNKMDDTYLPISAYTTTTGFIIGTNWAPTSITINPVNEKNRFEYQVLGTVEWQILGITFYYEAKDYQGFLEVK